MGDCKKGKRKTVRKGGRREKRIQCRNSVFAVLLNIRLKACFRGQYPLMPAKNEGSREIWEKSKVSENEGRKKLWGGEIGSQKREREEKLIRRNKFGLRDQELKSQTGLAGVGFVAASRYMDPICLSACYGNEKKGGSSEFNVFLFVQINSFPGRGSSRPSRLLFLALPWQTAVHAKSDYKYKEDGSLTW